MVGTIANVGSRYQHQYRHDRTVTPECSTEPMRLASPSSSAYIWAISVSVSFTIVPLVSRFISENISFWFERHAK